MCSKLEKGAEDEDSVERGENNRRGLGRRPLRKSLAALRAWLIDRPAGMWDNFSLQFMSPTAP